MISDRDYIFKVYLLKNGHFIGSCAPSERSNFIRFYMSTNKLKQAARVKFQLVKKGKSTGYKINSASITFLKLKTIRRLAIIFGTQATEHMIGAEPTNNILKRDYREND